MAAAETLKLCLVGPQECGKTYLARLLGGQGVGDGEYQPTSGVRVQKVEHTFRSAKVKVELWDCAGGADTKKFANVLADGLDGLVLAYDAGHPEQEGELEELFKAFAQPYNLFNTQILVAGLSTGQAGAKEKLKSKLSALPHVFLELPGQGSSRSQYTMAADTAASHLGRLMDKILRMRRENEQQQQGF